MDSFFELSGCELIALANILSIYFSNNLSLEEIGILANFFTIIGDNLAMLSSNPCNRPTQY